VTLEFGHEKRECRRKKEHSKKEFGKTKDHMKRRNLRSDRKEVLQSEAAALGQPGRSVFKKEK